jgi:anion-transporting  ArsA/GET3 family ATPase
VSPSDQPSARWPARLHVVTGKGGTGKTTVAAALALGLASGGRRSLLIEVEQRQGIAQVFDRAPLPYAERAIAVGYPGSAADGGGEVFALAVDAEEALLEYLDVFYHLGRAGKALQKLGAIDFATTIAPGVRDVLLTGKVKEAVTRTINGRRVYDHVVLDAPPTGRIGRFLNVTAETARLTKFGPIKSQSDGVTAVLRSPVTTVHVVTLLEEMPVQETIDAVTELHRLEMPVGAIIVNQTQPDLLPSG